MDKLLELKKAWMDSKTKIYLNKNCEVIYNYMKESGMPISKDEIKKFLNLQKTDGITYKNYGKREIAETGKEFCFRSAFFALMHADLLVLSKRRRYGTSSKFILVAVDQLSRWVFLRQCKSTRFEHQKRAWDDILSTIKNMGKNFKIEVLFHDAGVEFESTEFKQYLKGNNIKNNLIRTRPYRLSKNSPYAESAIRRVRMTLEKAVEMKTENDRFEDILKRVETMCNNEHLSSISMSAKSALDHEPSFIVCLSQSNRLKRRKHLRKELKNQAEIELRSVVKIRKNVDKYFSSVAKESYGHLSKLFVVVDINRSRPLRYYVLADLFTLKRIEGEYSKAELEKFDISYVDACDKESRIVTNIVSHKSDVKLVEYNIRYNDIVFIANDSLISSN